MRRRLSAAARNLLLDLVRDGLEGAWKPAGGLASAAAVELRRAGCIVRAGSRVVIGPAHAYALQLYEVTARGRTRAAAILRGREIRRLDSRHTFLRYRGSRTPFPPLTPFHRAAARLADGSIAILPWHVRLDVARQYHLRVTRTGPVQARRTVVVLNELTDAGALAAVRCEGAQAIENGPWTALAPLLG